MWIIPDCSLTFNEEIEIKLEGSILCKGTVVVTLVACESSFLEKESGKYFGPRCDVDDGTSNSISNGSHLLKAEDSATCHHKNEELV